MATDLPEDYESAVGQELRGIDDALVRAHAALSAMNDAASTADNVTDNRAEYSLHEVAGIGRYAVVRKTGWRPLLKVIHDIARANIDFSPAGYPSFDAKIGENFQSPYLLDPLNEKFNDYRNLRDNLAAVRNFLMETYYVNTPPGMTPEKAKQTLEEIAAYVGKGLHNNYLFLGMVPNHDPNAPHISINDASAPGGAGAQYIYEKILEMHRQSSWLRPFSAVLALFGAKSVPDWMLPPADATTFTDLFESDIAKRALADPNKPTQDQLNHVAGDIHALEAQRRHILGLHEINYNAVDLDAMANHLLFSASNMQNIATLSDPVKRDAIDHAKDILRNLKVKLGAINVMEGLNLSPNADLDALNKFRYVTATYEKLLSWGRGIDARIMQDPSVLAATQAIGQMGYLAKAEAKRLATIAGNVGLAERISGQLAQIPDVFAKPGDGNKNLAVLLDKVERGMDTILTRLQSLSGPGPKVGFSAANELGSTMNSAPTAGMAMTSQVATSQNNTAIANQQALAMAAQHQTARRQAAHPTASRTEEPRQQAARPAIGRPAPPQQKAKPSAAPTTPSATKPAMATGALSPAQLQAMRNNALHHSSEHEELEHQHQVKQMLDNQRLQAQTQKNNQRAAQKSAARAAVHKIDPSLLHHFQAATNTHGLTGPAVNPVAKGPYSVGQHVELDRTSHVEHVKSTKPLAQPGVKTEIQSQQDDKQHPPLPPQPNSPHRGGGGRGF